MERYLYELLLFGFTMTLLLISSFVETALQESRWLRALRNRPGNCRLFECCGGSSLGPGMEAHFHQFLSTAVSLVQLHPATRMNLSFYLGVAGMNLALLVPSAGNGDSHVGWILVAVNVLFFALVSFVAFLQGSFGGARTRFWSRFLNICSFFVLTHSVIFLLDR